MSQYEANSLSVNSSILSAIKGIELKAKHMVEEQLIGNYRSHFKGTGISFADLRQYNPGDEVRHIHWKASARSKKTFVKTYQEERQLSVMTLLDVSNSMSSQGENPLMQRAIELSALVAFLARAHGDLLGLCKFSSSVSTFLPCSNRRNHFYRLLHELVEVPPQSASFTNLADTLVTARHRLRRRTLLFIISDFFCPDFGEELKRLARGHDCVCCFLPHTLPLKACGLVRMRDSETDEIFLVDTSSKKVRKKINDQLKKHEEKVRAVSQQAGADFFVLDSDVAGSLRTFMQRRK
ncbi:MAG: DUF58 domain-containing protein [Bdellovibrionales bacterium]|nr:DUF58 domain-containing protein [Bdellovibrionales bacterium]